MYFFAKQSRCSFEICFRFARLRAQIRLVLEWIINNIMAATNNTEETRLYVKILTSAPFRNEWSSSHLLPHLRMLTSSLFPTSKISYFTLLPLGCWAVGPNRTPNKNLPPLNRDSYEAKRKFTYNPGSCKGSCIIYWRLIH